MRSSEMSTTKRPSELLNRPADWPETWSSSLAMRERLSLSAVRIRRTRSFSASSCCPAARHGARVPGPRPAPRAGIRSSGSERVSYPSRGAYGDADSH
jgi:hypothetical protein